jgi:hypothetical protein
MIALLVVAALAAPPCDKTQTVQPVRCAPVGDGWVCFHPKELAAELAAGEKALKNCEAEKRAAVAEAATVLRRDTGKLRASNAALTTKLELVIDIGKRAERRADLAAADAASRHSTWTVIGWTGGGLVVGAIVGALAVHYGTR